MKTRNKPHLLSESLVKLIKPDSILGEIMLGRVYFSNVGKNKMRKEKVYQASADRLVKVCPSCELTWEYVKVGSHITQKHTIYHKNVPKFGKKKEICTRCSEEEE
jgi:superfamily II helicase